MIKNVQELRLESISEKMNKIIIFGNSGSGKSTMAKSLARELQLSHLDLDSLAWLKTEIPVRRPLSESYNLIRDFTDQNGPWVIEGCYSDLIEYVVPIANEMIFLNPTTQQCIENARNRPWEPHKYESKEKQDANLDFLISWIKDYDNRDDVFSRKAHLRLYLEFTGKKQMIGGIEIKEFAPSDVSSLAKLFFETIREVNSTDYSPKQVEAWAPEKIDKNEWLNSFNNKIVLVAKEYDVPVGFCELKENGYIDRFYVAKNRIGQGVGNQLYQELEKRALTLGIKELFVDASITAKPFFEKLVFKTIRQQTVQLRGVDFTNYRMVKKI